VIGFAKSSTLQATHSQACLAAFLTLIRGLWLTAVASFSFSFSREQSMKKILVGLAILAVSTSAVMAKGKAKKPAAPAAAASTSSVSPLMAPVSAADLALYKKSQVESGMKKK
jgi:hypothetical protein